MNRPRLRHHQGRNCLQTHRLASQHAVRPRPLLHELESALDPATANDCPAVELDSEHPLYVLYTSGTTGKPKESFTPRLDTTSTPT